MRSWEIAPPEELSAGGGRTLHVPGLFLQLSVSPTASVCFEAALTESMFVVSKTPCHYIKHPLFCTFALSAFPCLSLVQF